MADANRTGSADRRNRAPNALASSIVLVCRHARLMRPPPRAASSSPRSRPSCPRRSPTCSAATSPRWTWRRRPSARAWRSTPATPKCSTPRARPLTVREALALINQTLDEALAEQEGDFDADSRWALAWFEQSGLRRGRVRRGRTALQVQEHERRRHGRGRHPRIEARQGAATRSPRNFRSTGIRPPTRASPPGRSSTT